MYVAPHAGEDIVRPAWRHAEAGRDDQPRALPGVSNNAPTIVLTNNASANPYRRISNVKTTTSNTWNGVTSAGVTAAWLAEGVATADSSPTVGNIVITPLKAAAWVN